MEKFASSQRAIFRPQSNSVLGGGSMCQRRDRLWSFACLLFTATLLLSQNVMAMGAKSTNEGVEPVRETLGSPINPPQTSDKESKTIERTQSGKSSNSESTQPKSESQVTTKTSAEKVEKTLSTDEAVHSTTVKSEKNPHKNDETKDYPAHEESGNPLPSQYSAPKITITVEKTNVNQSQQEGDSPSQAESRKPREAAKNQSKQENENGSTTLYTFSLMGTVSPGVFPWCIVSICLTFFFLAKQQTEAAVHRPGANPIQTDPNTRFFSFFAPFMWVILIANLGFAWYAYEGLFIALDRNAPMAWFAFSLGIVPLPAMVMDLLCASFWPHIGIGAVYDENIRSQPLLHQRILAFQEKVLTLVKQEEVPLWQFKKLRILWIRLTIWYEVYIRASVIIAHLNHNRIRLRNKPSVERNFQTFLDIGVIFTVLLTALSFLIFTIAFCFAFCRGQAISIPGPVLIDFAKSFFLLLFIAYAGVFIVGLAAIEKKQDSGTETNTNIKLVLLSFAGNVLLVVFLLKDMFNNVPPGVGIDLPVHQWPEDQSLIGLVNAKANMYLARLRTLFSGLTPIALLILVYVLAKRFQIEIMNYWLSVSGSIRERAPIELADRAMHAFGNLLVPPHYMMEELQNILKKIKGDDSLQFSTPVSLTPADANFLWKQTQSSLDALERARRLVQEMKGAQSLREQNIDWFPVSDLTQVFVEQSSTDKDLRCIITMNETTKKVSIQLDRAFFVDMLSNLYHNAADAVRLAKIKDPYVSITVNYDHDPEGVYPLTISIRDNGVGIPAEDRGKVFLPYWTKKGKGTGLGLYMAREFMKQLRGELKLTDSSTTPGQSGTTFSLFFPRSCLKTPVATIESKKEKKSAPIPQQNSQNTKVGMLIAKFTAKPEPEKGSDNE